jgi:predicted nucleic acid-binding Zn finger protein
MEGDHQPQIINVNILSNHLVDNFGVTSVNSALNTEDLEKVKIKRNEIKGMIKNIKTSAYALKFRRDTK